VCARTDARRLFPKADPGGPPLPGPGKKGKIPSEPLREEAVLSDGVNSYSRTPPAASSVTNFPRFLAEALYKLG